MKGVVFLNTNGLLVEPNFSNPQKYLQSGKRTKITEEIKSIEKI